MKRNKLLIVLLGVSIAFNILSLMGCTDKQLASAYASKRIYCVDSNFKTVRGNLVVDSQTGCEYWYIEPKPGEGGSYCLTLLVDPEGKPVIFKGE